SREVESPTLTNECVAVRKPEFAGSLAVLLPRTNFDRASLPRLRRTSGPGVLCLHFSTHDALDRLQECPTISGALSHIRVSGRALWRFPYPDADPASGLRVWSTTDSLDLPT